MIDELRFGLKQRFNIKCGIDLGVFVAFLVSFIIYSFKVGAEPTLCLTCFIAYIAVYIPYHFGMKQWMLRFIKKSLKIQAESLSDATGEILENLNSQRKVLDTITSNTKNISMSIAKLQDLSREALSTSKSTERQVSQSISYSEKEYDAISSNAEKMLVLRQKIQMIAELILELSEHTQQIGNTISVVDDIAEQTNMLALNAAVEAARAGEHGKGFAVVAGEIRKLADESKQAITKITALTSNIQYTTNSTVMATEEGSKEIETVVRDINNVSSSSEVLLNLIKSVLESLDMINQNAEKQSDVLDKLKVMDEDFINISEEFSRTLNTNLDKLVKMKELSNDIKNSAIEG